MKKFSDFSKETVLEGDKIKIDDILNEEVIIHNYRIKDSRYSKNESGKYLTIQISKTVIDPKKVVFTGSDVLIEQMKKYGHQLPFAATIRKINRYYTLT